MSRQRNKWERQGLHHCAICNVWLGSDRQSILLHENGKKHQENVENELQSKRKKKQKDEQYQNFVQASLRNMEQAALGSVPQSQLAVCTPIPMITPSIHAPPPPPPSAPTSSSTQEKEEWNKKRQRQREKGDVEEVSAATAVHKRKIAPGEGHYETSNGKVYLEATVFSEILEDDMPAQFWTGSNTASAQEKRLADRDHLWKSALVVRVRQRKGAASGADCHRVVDLCYLANDNDTEETLLKDVSTDRIRLVLGSDERIPDTLEEARLLAMGGEEIEVNQNEESATVDDATGFTGWSTVTVKRTTVRQELKDDRARQREKRKMAALEQEAQQKETKTRRMEEAKVANAEDSALGAVDVWGVGDYKGVDIAKSEISLTITDIAKKLTQGNKGSVAFKKKPKKKKGNRRTTSADD